MPKYGNQIADFRGFSNFRYLGNKITDYSMALKLRSDHGSQYDSNDFMAEMKFLGLNMSKAFEIGRAHV